MVLQLLDRFDTAQRHVRQQRDDLHGGVITSQRREARIEVAKQAVLCQPGHGAEYAAEADIATRLELREGAARQQSKGGTDPLHQSRAGHPQAVGCGDVLLAALRFIGSVVGAIVFFARRFGQPSLVDGFAERVVLDAELASRIAA